MAGSRRATAVREPASATRPARGRREPEREPVPLADLQRGAGNRAVQRLVQHPAAHPLVLQRSLAKVQRHSEAALEEQLEDAAAVTVQRHAFPRHERFAGASQAVPANRQWRLASVVPFTEVSRLKRGLLARLERLFPGSDGEARRADLRRRVIRLTIVEDAAFHSPAQGQPGRVVINPSSREFYLEDFRPDIAAIRSTIVHELFHASSINHGDGKAVDEVAAEDKGFQSEQSTLVKQGEAGGGGTQETFDEAATEWFAQQLYAQMYPNETYRSSYFLRALETKGTINQNEGLSSVVNATEQRPTIAPSKDQVKLVMTDLGIGEDQLLEWYVHDHDKLTKRLAADKDRLKTSWRQHLRSELERQHPSTTTAGVTRLLSDMIAEHRGELARCDDQAKQRELLADKLKKQHGVELSLVDKTHSAEGKKLFKPLPATPGAAAALAHLPAPAQKPKVPVPNAPAPGQVAAARAAPTPVLNAWFVRQALKDLKVNPAKVAAPLSFVLVTPDDRSDRPLNAYPAARRYGTPPAVPMAGDAAVTPYERLVGYGGGGYEAAMHTAFLISDHAASYHHYLHEVGHYVQHLAGFDETTVPNTILLDFHNILMHENTAEHVRTLYSTKDSMATLVRYGKTIDDVRNDVAAHTVMRKMFGEIEDRIAALDPVYQELYRRNLTYEYFKKQDGVLKNWRNPGAGRS